MTEQAIKQLLATEFNAPTWGTTEQYLKIHKVLYQGGLPVVARITQPDSDGVISVYLPVEGEKFYLVSYLNSESGRFTGLGTEPWVRVCLRATSETLSATEMAGLTTLLPTTQWNRGDMRRLGRGVYSFSSLSFLPNPEPDTFECKLEKLLDFLEQDVAGVQQLSKQADCGIDVALDMHNGNGMLGGPILTAHAIQRIAALGLSIDFDLYAAGNPFTEDE